MNWTSFKRSPVLKCHFFFVPKNDLLLQVWLYQFYFMLNVNAAIVFSPISYRPTRLVGFYCASSLKQQTSDRYVAPLIILIPSQPVFSFSRYCCVLNAEATTTNTDPGADPWFQFRGADLKKIAPIVGRREHFWGISC